MPHYNFPVGTTTVTCTATDIAGNEGTANHALASLPGLTSRKRVLPTVAAATAARGGTTADRSFEKQIDFPIGDPRKPMSSEQMDSKFDALCGDEVPAAKREVIRTAIADMENVSASDFMALLTYGG